MAKRLVISKRIFKSLTPEQQAGLQNIGALIDQMLQSGQADVVQQGPQPSPAVPAAPPAPPAAPPPHPAAAAPASQPPAPPKAPPKKAPPEQGDQPPFQKSLDDAQSKTRIGGPVPNEESDMGKKAKPNEEAEDETERAPNLGGKMDKVSKTAEDLGQPEARGFRGKSPLIDSDEGDELINASEPAGKLSPQGHPGADATSFAEHRIGDLPIYDEEGAEAMMQDGNDEGEAPGKSNPKATANKELVLLRAIARRLQIPMQRVARKSLTPEQEEIREVRKAVEYLIQKLDPVGAKAAGIMQGVEKEEPARGPVYRNDGTDDKSRLVVKALLEELGVRGVGREVREDMSTVRKALRDEGLPTLAALARTLWGEL